MITKVNSEDDVMKQLDEQGQLKLRTPLNIFIGGQILDRGITVQNLIGFFYGRRPNRFQQDTVLQHSRMFGLRPGRSDLAKRVHSISDDHRKGYDIASFDEDETPRLIEVKAARRDKGVMTFFLSENEWKKSRTLPNYFFYLVFDARAVSVSIRYFPANQLNSEALRPIVHTASIVES